MSVSSSDSERSGEFDLSNPDVTTKYRTAGDIATKVLKKVLGEIKEGADIFDLCTLGDEAIREETGKVYNKRVKDSEWEKKDAEEKKKEEGGRKVDKGIAFPTCISVNELAGHYSPIAKNESRVLRSGDVVKVDLGVHIDGFIAQGAHTIVCSGDESGSAGPLQIQDRRADVVQAAYSAAECAVRMLAVGNKNSDVTAVIQKAADEFKCQPVAGVLSHRLKRHCIDSDDCIIQKEAEDQKVDELEFGLNEVWTLDVMLSSGDGKLKETELRHTVYKRALDQSYMLKTAKARQFIGEVNRSFPTLPFSLSMISDQQCARVGVSEAKRHELLIEYPVMTERAGEFVAHFKFTVALLPGGSKKLVEIPYEQKTGAYWIDPQYQIEDEQLAKLLATSTKKNKRRNKKSKDDSKDE